MNGIVDVLLELTVEGLTTRSRAIAADRTNPGIAACAMVDDCPSPTARHSRQAVQRLEPQPL